LECAPGLRSNAKQPLKSATFRKLLLVNVASDVGTVMPAGQLETTFILSVADALEMPTRRAVLLELVEKEELAAVAVRKGIEFISREQWARRLAVF